LQRLSATRRGQRVDADRPRLVGGRECPVLGSPPDGETSVDGGWINCGIDRRAAGHQRATPRRLRQRVSDEPVSATAEISKTIDRVSEIATAVVPDAPTKPQV